MPTAGGGRPRLAPVAVLVLAALAAWLAGRAAPAWRFAVPGQSMLALALVAAGVAIAASGVAAFGRSRTTVDPLHPQAATSLVRGGPYRFTRNPMYLGMGLALAGWCVWVGSAPGLAVLPAFVLYLTRFQIVPEERALSARFGPDFEAYGARVRRWI